MFNFFVTGLEGAWEGFGYLFSRSRFLEYTGEDVAVSFKELKEPQIKALMNMPCLFAYEGTREPFRVGKLLNIKPRGTSGIFIEFEIDSTIAPIEYNKIALIKDSLDIREWEMNRTHWAIKDEDLFGILRRANIIDRPEVDDSHERVDKSSLPLPSLPRNNVDNVGDFIANVLQIGNGDQEVFYRGHSKRIKYLLEPSLFRKDGDGNFRYLNREDRMYRELLVSNSGDFGGDVYTLDRLVRAQHYSLPTRLLDITSNPLIGLYFACSSNQDEDGEVIVFSVDSSQVKYFDSDTASCIANLARLPQADKDAIDYQNEDVMIFNDQLPVKRLLHFIKEEKPFFEGRICPSDLKSVVCVKGKHTNNRISFQSGAFLLFGHDATLAEEGNDVISVQRIGITNKASILKQLDQLNINERTVYPNIDNSAKYIANRFAFKKT